MGGVRVQYWWGEGAVWVGGGCSMGEVRVLYGWGEGAVWVG